MESGLAGYRHVDRKTLLRQWHHVTPPPPPRAAVACGYLGTLPSRHPTAFLPPPPSAVLQMHTFWYLPSHLSIACTCTSFSRDEENNNIWMDEWMDLPVSLEMRDTWW